jgi:hypothetical protein
MEPARRLSTGADGLFTGDLGRVNNPPQVSNLPHNFRRIPVSGKSMWHWAESLRHAGADVLSEQHWAKAMP